MRGTWTWPSDPREQEKALRRLRREDELLAILASLSNDPEGLSNAQLDRNLNNNSQWRTRSHMEEVIALGFVLYDVKFFGEAGKYHLTDLGRSVLLRLQPERVP